MSYVINVAYMGNRYFSTSRGSCKNASSAVALLADLSDRFPADDGYKVECVQLATEAIVCDKASLVAQALDAGD